MTQIPRLVATAVAGAIALVAFAGCGVPLDDTPRPINNTTVATSSSVPTTISPTGAATVPVYFLNGDRLQAVEYPVEGEATLGKALDFVLAAPPEDGSAGLRTSVPPGTRLRGVEVADGLATIDLTGEISDVGGSPQKEAFAQIVFTALGFDEVQEVQFQIDGKPIDAPTDDGNVAIVSADAYDPPLNPR
jgi:spore germination protein GerM